LADGNNSPKIELKPGEKILVSRTDRLGDLILALPLVETIKTRYPECQVEVMSSLYASPILENNKRIDKIVRVQNDQLRTSKLYRKDMLHKLRMSGHKVVVALYPERQICRLFYKATIPMRIGTVGRFHSVFFNYHLFHSRKANKKHEYEYNLDFLRFFRDGATVTTPTVYPKDKDLRNARRILDEAGVKDRFIVLHPGSGGSAERWPLDKFIRLYSRLKQRGLEVIISGSAQEKPIIEKGAGRLGIPVNHIAGETDLRTLAAVLSLASAAVANSTGPLHLAVAVGTKVVGLYPSRRIMSPVRWGPLGDGHRVIQPPGSDDEAPPDQLVRMDTIPVDQAASEAEAVFRKCAR
jgi:ADP-heptose:LPS heptosyltransferase